MRFRKQQTAKQRDDAQNCRPPFCPSTENESASLSRLASSLDSQRQFINRQTGTEKSNKHTHRMAIVSAASTAKITRVLLSDDERLSHGGSCYAA